MNKKQKYQDCSACDQWLSKVYWNRHLMCKKHVKKSRQLNQCFTLMKFPNDTNPQEPVANNSKVYDTWQLQGSTFKHCKHQHTSILDRCECFGRISPHVDMFDSVKQQKIDKEQALIDSLYNEDIPQTLVVTSWSDVDSCQNDAQVSPSPVEDEPVDWEDLQLIDVASSTKSEEHQDSVDLPSSTAWTCLSEHDNQISLFKCKVCCPQTYKDYANW